VELKLAKKNKYIWKIGEALPTIDDHSLVKLNILERYLEIYLKFLTKNCFMSNLKLTIIDGFAGGGIYKNNITGSPLRIKQAVEKAKKIIQFERESNNCRAVTFDIDYKFIERNKDTFTFLKQALVDYDFYCSKTECILGRFSSNLDQLIQGIKDKGRAERSIFILDQYGYADAPVKDIKKIFLNLKKAEVILTFSIDSLIDYLSRFNYKILENLGLSKDDIEVILDVREDNEFTRSKIQPILYKIIVAETQAPYYTPFFIKSDVSNRAYWLFHFSTHPTARDEMIKLHWDEQNTFQHFGRAGLKMLLGYNSDYKENLFEFDDFAKEKSIKTLQEELPELIYNVKEVSFGHLKNAIINETPATVDFIKQSLTPSMDSGEIIVKASDQKTLRKRGTTIQDDDIIKWTHRKQTFLF